MSARHFWALVYIIYSTALVHISAAVCQYDSKYSDTYYSISVMLDTEQMFLVGNERISWRNTSTNAVSELYFKLDWNTLHKLHISDTRRIYTLSENLPDQNNGSITITKISIFNGPDLTSTIRYPESSDFPNNMAYCRILLPGGIAPGEIIELDLDFKAVIPSIAAGTGFTRQFIFAESWFPRVFSMSSDPSGTCLEEYGNNINTYASFKVNISVPDNYVIGASGELLNKVRNNEITTYTYSENDICDFVWTVDTNFLEFNDVYKHPSYHQVNLTLLLQPEHQDKSERYFNTAKNTLNYLVNLFGFYPYTTLTVIDVPRDAMAVDGKGYQTIITARSSKIPAENHYKPELDIIQGITSQYRLGFSDGETDRLFDSAFNIYLEAKVMQAVLGDYHEKFDLFNTSHNYQPLISYKGIPLIAYWGSVKNDFNETGTSRTTLISGVVKRDLAQYGEERIYNNTVRLILTLNKMIGDNEFNVIIRSFFENKLYNKPSAIEFAEHISTVTGYNWRGIFEDVLSNGNIVDYEVTAIDNRKDGTKSKEINSEMLSSSATFVKTGEISLPVDIGITFENGDTLMFEWDGEESPKTFEFTNSSDILYAEIDPLNKVLLDNNRINNSLRSNASLVGPARWINKCLFWIQNFFHILSSII